MSIANIFKSDSGPDTSNYISLRSPVETWEEQIMEAFYKALGDFHQGEIEDGIDFSKVDDISLSSMGNIKYRLGDKLLIFPFVVKDGELSPFDVFVDEHENILYNNPRNLRRIVGRSILGDVEDEKKKNESRKRTGFRAVSDSLEDAFRAASSTKFSSYLGKNLEVLNRYCEHGTEDILSKWAEYKIPRKFKPDSLAVKPVGKFRVKVAYVDDGQYYEDDLSISDAYKKYSEYKDVIDECLESQKTSALGNLGADGISFVNFGNEDDLRPYRLYRKSETDSDVNVLNWFGNKINYKLELKSEEEGGNESFAGPKTNSENLRAHCKYVLKIKKGDGAKYSTPFWVQHKIRVRGKVSLDCLDAFHKKVRLLFLQPDDFGIKYDEPIGLTQVKTDNEKQKIPMFTVYKTDLDGYAKLVLINEDPEKIEFLKIEEPDVDQFYQKLGHSNSQELQVRSDGIKFSVSGADGFMPTCKFDSHLKAATVLSYYTGKYNDVLDKAKTTKEMQTVKYIPTPKTAGVQPKDEPIFLKISSYINDENIVDNLLSMNFMTQDNIDEFAAKREDLSPTIDYLTKLLLKSRVDGKVPEHEVKAALMHVMKIKEKLDQIFMGLDD